MIDGLWENIFKKTKEENNILEILKGVPMLNNLSNNELREFERIVHRRNYKANENIFWQGEPGVGMYIIQSGSVKIYNTLPDSGIKELATLKMGDFFGELALLDESPRSASANALEACQILGLYRPDLFDLLERRPKLGLKVMTKLAQIIGNRLRITSSKLQSIYTAEFYRDKNQLKIDSNLTPLLEKVEVKDKNDTLENLT